MLRPLICWGSGLLDSTVGCSLVLTSFTVLVMSQDPTFRAYLVPGGALQKPLLGEVLSVPLAAKAGLGLHPGDFHVATPELALCTFGLLLCFNCFDRFFQ